MGMPDHLVIHGHVLALSPLPRKKYRKSILNNAVALLRLFMVKPVDKVQFTNRSGRDKN